MRQALLIQGDRRTEIAWPRDKARWAVGGSDAVLWLNLQAPDRAELEELAAEFGLNPAVVDDYSP